MNVCNIASRCPVLHWKATKHGHLCKIKLFRHSEPVLRAELICFMYLLMGKQSEVLCNRLKTAYTFKHDVVLEDYNTLCYLMTNNS